MTAARTALITCVDRYMGRAIQTRFEALGLEVVANDDPVATPRDCERLVADAGRIDILVANLAEPPRSAPVQAIDDADWMTLFDALVHPLMYLVRATVPQMLERGQGKIIAVTSAAPLRGIPNNAAYCAARAAQNGFIKAVGMELARSNIQVNAIAQNYINNETYYPDNLIRTDRFQDHIRRNVPTGRIGAAEETAELAAYLASERCTHVVGQIIPLAGGWAT
jgi:NAD(P)-dependent dehydrogenase (short-subunit alcohol dehydrogenase family)